MYAKGILGEQSEDSSFVLRITLKCTFQDGRGANDSSMKNCRLQLNTIEKKKSNNRIYILKNTWRDGTESHSDIKMPSF